MGSPGVDRGAVQWQSRFGALEFAGSTIAGAVGMSRSLRDQIAALSEAEPALASDLSLRGVLIAVLEGADVRAPNLVIPADRLRAKLARGVPLLDGEAVAVPPSLLPLFERLAVAWLADARLGGSVEPLLMAVRGHLLHVEQVLAEAIAGHDDHLTALAEGAHVDPVLLGSLADLASRPLLVALAERLRPALALGPWERGYCPICGAQPIFAESTPDDPRLRCGRCLMIWGWPLTRCPYGDGDAILVLDTHVESVVEGWTACVWNPCRNFLKVAQVPVPDRLADTLLADLVSWRLDRAAVEAGLRRPDGPGYRLELQELESESDDEAFDDA
jgi:FdhE protein